MGTMLFILFMLLFGHCCATVFQIFAENYWSSEAAFQSCIGIIYGLNLLLLEWRINGAIRLRRRLWVVKDLVPMVTHSILLNLHLHIRTSRFYTRLNIVACN